ncbi:3-oxoacyl-ACP synthase [Aquimarina sp. U1-2]|uniref:3-oxoacyl-ACP synthase n=1 Tax=Aquimarina sp. U1-2 TaxID=2823141 RepID=UPI001FEDB256|nr:3-oxoacyl-ACP synthase [Aquimarina sp. U1-2]
MLQLEREKAGKQLAEVQKLREILHKIAISTSSDRVCLGSLVITSNGNYFVSISMGKIKVNNEIYVAVAANSPLGKLLIGRSNNEAFNFLEQQITILKVL